MWKTLPVKDWAEGNVMKATALLARLVCAVAMAQILAGCVSPREAAPVVQYANGYWYDGAGFEPRDAFVSGGVFVKRPRSKPEQVIDLAGGYVTPGFAEGHHHTVLCDPGRIKQFLDNGIVYAAIMNARVSSRECEAKFHGKDGLEVKNALAGLTARNAHPSQIGLYFLKADEIDGEWVYYIDSAEELNEKWDRIVAAKPDFIKIFLSYSEDFERLRDDPDIASWYRGLDPALVPGIVSRAHQAGLKVAAHVMSAHDFDTAVRGGVDIIAHMPGFAPGPAFTGEDDPSPYLKALLDEPDRYLITPSMAKEAAARGVYVVTTVSGAEKAPSDVIKRNIAALRAANVTLLIGSDRGEYNSVDEAEYLVEYDLMTASEVLHSLAVTTPRVFFPGRRIGELAPGAEATFVVLGADPLANFSAIRDVEMVVKNGVTLRPEETPD